MKYLDLCQKKIKWKLGDAFVVLFEIDIVFGEVDFTF